MNAPRLPPLTCICEGRGSSTNRDQEPVDEGQKHTAVFLEFTHQEQKGSFHIAFILVFWSTWNGDLQAGELFQQRGTEASHDELFF